MPLWFGPETENTTEETEIKKIKLESYEKSIGNKFYIPKSAKDFIKERNKKGWKRILNTINNIHISRTWKIHTRRLHEHGKIMKTNEMKRKFVTGKITEIDKDNLILTKTPKWNEIIDLTENKPFIIVDLTMKRKRNNITNKKEKNKKTKVNKQIVITGEIIRPSQELIKTIIKKEPVKETDK